MMRNDENCTSISTTSRRGVNNNNTSGGGGDGDDGDHIGASSDGTSMNGRRKKSTLTSASASTSTSSGRGRRTSTSSNNNNNTVTETTELMETTTTTATTARRVPVHQQQQQQEEHERRLVLFNSIEDSIQLIRTQYESIRVQYNNSIQNHNHTKQVQQKQQQQLSSTNGIIGNDKHNYCSTESYKYQLTKLHEQLTQSTLMEQKQQLDLIVPTLQNRFGKCSNEIKYSNYQRQRINKIHITYTVLENIIQQSISICSNTTTTNTNSNTTYLSMKQAPPMIFDKTSYPYPQQQQNDVICVDIDTTAKATEDRSNNNNSCTTTPVAMTTTIETDGDDSHLVGEKQQAVTVATTTPSASSATVVDNDGLDTSTSVTTQQQEQQQHQNDNHNINNNSNENMLAAATSNTTTTDVTAAHSCTANAEKTREKKEKKSKKKKKKKYKTTSTTTTVQSTRSGSSIIDLTNDESDDKEEEDNQITPASPSSSSSSRCIASINIKTTSSPNNSYTLSPTLKTRKISTYFSLRRSTTTTTTTTTTPPPPPIIEDTSTVIGTRNATSSSSTCNNNMDTARPMARTRKRGHSPIQDVDCINNDDDDNIDNDNSNKKKSKKKKYKGTVTNNGMKDDTISISSFCSSTAIPSTLSASLSCPTVLPEQQQQQQQQKPCQVATQAQAQPKKLLSNCTLALRQVQKTNQSTWCLCISDIQQQQQQKDIDEQIATPISGNVNQPSHTQPSTTTTTTAVRYIASCGQRTIVIHSMPAKMDDTSTARIPDQLHVSNTNFSRTVSSSLSSSSTCSDDKKLSSSSTSKLSSSSSSSMSPSSSLEPILIFKEKNPKEDYFTCTFAGETTIPKLLSGKDDSSTASLLLSSPPPPSSLLLCAGGATGVIRVLDLSTKSLRCTLSGHGDGILDLKVSPVNKWLLASASCDTTIRIWNLQLGSQQCVLTDPKQQQSSNVTTTNNPYPAIAILGGQFGHRGAVISASWQSSGYHIASCGYDRVIKIWDVSPDTILHHAIDRSFALSSASASASSTEMKQSSSQTTTSLHVPHATTVVEQFPKFSTNKVHSEVVDSLSFWKKDCIISKSVDEFVVLWKPIYTNDKYTYRTNATSKRLLPPPENVMYLRRFQLQHTSCWYVRLTTTLVAQSNANWIAVGNMKGEVQLWDIAAPSTVATVSSFPSCSVLVPQSCCKKVRVPYNSKQQEQTQNLTIRSVEFTPEGDTMFAATENGSILIWDIIEKKSLSKK